MTTSPDPHVHGREGNAAHRRRLPAALVLLAVGLVGAAAGLLALQLGAAVDGDLGPGSVEVRAGVIGSGRTELLLPPLGQISARTHRPPVVLSARVEVIDVDDLQRLLAQPDPVGRLEREVESDLRAVLVRLGIRAAVVALVGGALAGALLPRRRWTFVLAGGVGGVAAAGLLLGGAWLDYDSRAFEEPRFSGPIERAPSILAAARRHVSGLGDVRQRIATLGENVAALYAATDPGAARRGPRETRVLHVSDIHSNPVGLELTRRLATGFDVNAVLDTGDLTSFGLPLEANLSRLIADIPVPYVYVPGNHDSTDNRAAVGRLPNVTVLDDDVASIGGLRVLGVADPTFTADNRLSTEQAHLTRLAYAPVVARLVDETRPDVLAVHDAVLADLTYNVPLVVAGHAHRASLVRRGGTIVVTVGSTGATGLESFLVETERPYEAEILSFSGTRLVSIDYVTLHGLEGEFRVERRLIDEMPALRRLG